MSTRTIIVAAMIVGGAIVAASFQTRQRFSLSAADGNIAWRLDTWSGAVDICAAAYSPSGPVVRCGAIVAVQLPDAAPNPDEPRSTDPAAPSPPASLPLDGEGNRSL